MHSKHTGLQETKQSNQMSCKDAHMDEVFRDELVAKEMKFLTNSL